jgi:hypothetical protein
MTGRFLNGREDYHLLGNIFTRMWLMTFGALPVLLAAGFVLRVNHLPSAVQVGAVAYVALSTGLIATGLFLFARQNLARSGDTIAAVDATQTFEVPFALLFEVGAFGAPLPDMLGWVGVLAVMIGVFGYVLTAHGEEGLTVNL